MAVNHELPTPRVSWLDVASSRKEGIDTAVVWCHSRYGNTLFTLCNGHLIHCIISLCLDDISRCWSACSDSACRNIESSLADWPRLRAPQKSEVQDWCRLRSRALFHPGHTQQPALQPFMLPGHRCERSCSCSEIRSCPCLQTKATFAARHDARHQEVPPPPWPTRQC